jgi:hypothetical protein
MYQFTVFFTRLMDNLVVAIGSNTIALKFDEVVSSFLSEKMR